MVKIIRVSEEHKTTTGYTSEFLFQKYSNAKIYPWHYGEIAITVVAVDAHSLSRPSYLPQNAADSDII